jgi:predicted AAA+ superfamily ATPase
MPHQRQRLLTETLIEKLNFSPVVAIQGDRQTGKSFIAREILRKNL